MRCPRIQLSIRSLLIGVALVGLNLAGAIATARYKDDWQKPRIGSVCENIFHYPEAHASKDAYFVYSSKLLNSGTRTRTIKWLYLILYTPPPATLPQVWSPLIMSVSMTLLVLITATWSRGTLDWERPA